MLGADEIGPVSLKPHGGMGIFPRGHPDRVPAQHVRRQGIRYEYMCLNVYHQRLSVSQQKHKGWRPWLKFISHERDRYPPDQRVSTDTGQSQCPLDSGGEGMGKGEQYLPCTNSNECKLDEPCRVQCRGYRASGTVRHKLHRLAAGEMDFREGNQLQKQGKGEERQEIQGHAGRKEKAQKTSVEAALEPSP